MTGWFYITLGKRQHLKESDQTLSLLQGEMAKIIEERNVAQARLRTMEMRAREKLNHEDEFCLLCYLLDS